MEGIFAPWNYTGVLFETHSEAEVQGKHSKTTGTVLIRAMIWKGK